MRKKRCRGTGPTDEFDTSVVFHKSPVLFLGRNIAKNKFLHLSFPAIFSPSKNGKTQKITETRSFLACSVAALLFSHYSFLHERKIHHIEPLEASFGGMEKRSNYQVYDKLFQC